MQYLFQPLFGCSAPGAAIDWNSWTNDNSPIISFREGPQGPFIIVMCVRVWPECDLPGQTETGDRIHLLQENVSDPLFGLFLIRSLFHDNRVVFACALVLDRSEG